MRSTTIRGSPAFVGSISNTIIFAVDGKTGAGAPAYQSIDNTIDLFGGEGHGHRLGAARRNRAGLNITV